MDPPRPTDLGYSMKNIPLPSATAYRKSLVEKVESVIRRMRWRAHFFLNVNKAQGEGAETYGFPSQKPTPKVPQLKAFEDDLLSVVADIKFRHVKDTFQEKLKKDVKTLTDTGDIIVKADKTKTLYTVSKTKYEKLLTDNVTANYRQAPESTYAEINQEAKQLAQKLKIDDLVDVMAKSEAFVTLKDHKARFQNNLPCRLINPAKSELGVISKAILDRAVSATRAATSVNIWKSTASVIEWFNGIDNKSNHMFVCFDVIEYYPSITETLLTKALDFASLHTTITNEERRIIKHARKSVLFKDGQAWTKKDNNTLFDITMGSYDGAEACELVGAYLLHQLSEHLPKEQIGLYWDDGLAVMENVSGSAAERLKKKLVAVFSANDLRVTIETDLKVVSFLDVTFNLSTGGYRPTVNQVTPHGTSTPTPTIHQTY